MAGPRAQDGPAIGQFLHAHAVRHFPTMGTRSLGENLIASENGFPPGQGRESVDIYALPTLHLKVRGLAAPQRCSLDRLA